LGHLRPSEEGFPDRNQSGHFKSSKNFTVMENANSILENPLLLVAILLFLALLPLALREKKKTKLEKAIERFEKEELRTAADGKTAKNSTPQRRPIPSTSQNPQENGDIPPFPPLEVEEGAPISKNDGVNSPEAPSKKVKLVKQEFSIAPSKNKTNPKTASPESQNKRKSEAPAKNQKLKSEEYLHMPPLGDNKNEESDDSWIEAEIPGLIMESPPISAGSKNVPTFKKEKPPAEVEKTQKVPKKEKQGMKVKNIVPESEEKKDPKQINSVRVEMDSPKPGVEISKSKPKAVEIKAPLVSHKSIAKNKTGKKKAKKSSSSGGKGLTTEAVVKAVPHQRKKTKTSPEKVRPKPFLLDVKYLDKGEPETASPVSDEILSEDMADAVIARLNALQNNLENQFVSIPGELTPDKNLVSEDARRDRTQDSFPDLKGKNGVSLKELDSFLFTAIQRKNRE
jgi:hypothetical protein